MTWKKLMEKDCHQWKLTTVNPQEKNTWLCGVRVATRAASHLPRVDPINVDDASVPAC